MTTRVSSASLLMHPLMVQLSPLLLDGWKANVQIRNMERFRAGALCRGQEAGELESTVSAVSQWFFRNRVVMCETQRALLDLKQKKYWFVDFVCELGGDCCLVCVFHGRSGIISKSEKKYMERIVKLSKQTYMAEVHVLAIKVWGDQRRTFTWQAGNEGNPLRITEINA
jgi:hypothetical protein